MSCFFFCCFVFLTMMRHINQPLPSVLRTKSLELMNRPSKPVVSLSLLAKSCLPVYRFVTLRVNLRFLAFNSFESNKLA